jgi:hypothetical protein
MLIASVAIPEFLARFNDPDPDVCKTAVNGFVDLAKLGKVNILDYVKVTDNILDNICQPAIISDAISALALKFGDSNSDVCKMVINGFVNLATHSKP